MRKSKTLIYFALSAVFVCFLLSDTPAQRRDHLTAEEVELVRDVQDVDLRMELFAKAIERRLWVLNGVDTLTEEQRKRVEKDLDKWGELPAGTRIELLTDIGKILTEAVDKLEDVYEQQPESEYIPFAYKAIADYSEALVPRLKGLAEKTADKMELALLDDAAIQCRDILEVRDTVPKPSGKRPKAKKS